MWDLYVEYEKDLELRRPFDANSEYEQARGRQAAAAAPPAVPPGAGQPPAPAPIQPAAPGPGGLAPGVQVPPQLLQQLAAQAAPPTIIIAGMKAAVIESANHADVFESDLKLKKISAGPQDLMQAEVIRREWTREQ